MARKPDELKAYITDLCKEKNFSEEDTRIAVAAATGDAAALQGVASEVLARVTAPLLDLTVGRQSDYSRAMNEAQTEKQKAADHYAKLEAWRTGQVLPEIQRLKAANEALSKGGTKPDDNEPNDDETVDADALRAGVKGEIARDFLAFEAEKAELNEIHFDLFKRPLDTRPLLEVIAKAAGDLTNPRSMSLREAFQAVHGAKIKEISDTARADELKAARLAGKEEGRKEVLAANAGRTGAAVPAGSGMFWDTIGKESKPDPVISDAEKQSLFNQDLSSEMRKNEEEFNRQTS